MTDDPAFSRIWKPDALGTLYKATTDDRLSPPGIIRKILERTCGKRVRNEHSLETDLGIDRDKFLELRTALELALRIEFFRGDFQDVEKVSDLIALVLRKLEAGAHPPHRTIQ